MLMAFGLCLWLTPALTPAQTIINAKVDPSFPLVKNFEGWGTSLCWWANVCGGYANRSTYASLAFSTLKLNIVRYNIGGGENPGIPDSLQYRAQMQGFEPTNGSWNWNADANQRWMLRQAVAMGANHVVAFANSPPWWMTVSGSVTGSVGGTTDNLQAGYETSFANYLATVVSNLTVLDGVHFDMVTPMNEPTGTWWVYGGGQEGCHMDANQQGRVVNDLRAALNAQNIDAGIDASEDTDEQDTINSINTYGSGQTNITLIASHTYGANNPTGIRDLSASWEVPAWISEYGDGDATGITMARRIHDDITGAWVRAWVYWQVVDNASGWGFLYNPLDGSGNTAITLNEKFYVMGQFSEFIRPGFQIINVNDNYSLAAYNPTNQTLVIVALNDTTNSLILNYNLNAFAALPTQLLVTRTSPQGNFLELAPIPVSNNVFSATLIPQSVTTFVLNHVAAPASASSRQAWYMLEGNANDASGNANNGTVIGATFVPGKLGALAAQFNGANSYIQIPLSISNNFTISFWLKTTDVGGGPQWWAGKGLVDGEVQGTADDFGTSLVGGSAAFGIGNPDTTIITTNAVNDGLWHHIAATRDVTSGQMLIYVDGTLEASGFGPVGTKNAPPALRIGGIQAGYSGDFLNGIIDDVQLFNRVYAAMEIPLLMNHPPAITSLQTNFTILAGSTLTITNTASDPDQPAQTLAWSLSAPPAGATINPNNGIFSWRPGMAQSPSTNLIVVQVSDNGTPMMAATQTWLVTVIQPVPPSLSVPALLDGNFSMTVSGDSGPDYVVENTTNLGGPANWQPVFTNLAAVTPFQFTAAGTVGSPPKFYRVRLQP